MDPQPTTYDTSGASKKTIIIICLSVLLVASLAFGGWAYSKMSDYKTKSDAKSAAAVSAANKQLTAQLQAQFDQQSKSPNKTFNGSPTYGSVTFNYPKTWSAYVDTTGTSEPINAYFNPDQVPSLQSKTAFALRVELLNSDYSQVVSQLNSSVNTGLVTSKAYLPPKLKGSANVTPGVYLTGHINSQDQSQTGAMVVIKVRDKTLEVYTEGADFQSDFNNTMLSSLSFAP